MAIPPVAAERGALARLTYGSPLRNRRTAQTVVLLLAVILAIAIAVNFLYVRHLAQADVARTFLVALPITALLSLVPIAVVWWLDRAERESPWLYLAAILWGMLIATALAIPANQGILGVVARWLRLNPEVADYFGKNAVLIIGAPIAGPLVEEITKGIGIVLLFWLLRDEFDNMRDGFVYGALVGIGFNMFEAPSYIANGLAQYGFAPWGIQLGGRFALFGLAGHALFSGLFGAGLGLARQSGRRWVQIAAPIAGMLLAIGAHAVNNALGLVVIAITRSMGQSIPDSDPTADMPFIPIWIASTIKSVIIFLPFLIALFWALKRSGEWERAVIREELQNEAPEIVSADDLKRIAALRTLGERTAAGLSARNSARLVNAQNEIAFRKHRLKRDGRNPESDPLIAGWRAEVRALRGIRPS
jgi:protease PrsW